MVMLVSKPPTSTASHQLTNVGWVSVIENRKLQFLIIVGLDVIQYALCNTNIFINMKGNELFQLSSNWKMFHLRKNVLKCPRWMFGWTITNTVIIFIRMTHSIQDITHADILHHQIYQQNIEIYSGKTWNMSVFCKWKTCHRVGYIVCTDIGIGMLTVETN